MSFKTGDRVDVDGYKAVITGVDPSTGYYEVKFDKGHPFAVDTWDLPESRLKKVMTPFPTFGEWSFEYGSRAPEAKKCDCGAHKLPERDQTPYSHAQWCIKFKRENIE